MPLLEQEGGGKAEYQSAREDRCLQGAGREGPGGVRDLQGFLHAGRERPGQEEGLPFQEMHRKSL